VPIDRRFESVRASATAIVAHAAAPRLADADRIRADRAGK
jgi:hypothetical protein